MRAGGRDIGRSQLAIGLVLLAILSALSAPAWAEDVKGKWYFGGNLSYLSTTDSIRSNAGLFIGPFGDDGLPGTADPNEALSCNDTGAFCDPRPDHLLGRETTIEETFKYDLTAGFGLTSWLSLQLDASYFRGDVGPVDFYISNVSSPISQQAAEFLSPLTVGELTEFPVTLTAIVRFRKDSTLNPYIGIGAGMIFSEINESAEVRNLNDRIQRFRIRGITDEFNQDIAGVAGPLASEGRIPTDMFLLDAEIEDALEWHVTGGGEYFFNDRLSMVFDARYTFADQDLSLLMGGEDQVNYTIFNEQLFRLDGSLRFFNGPAPASPSPFCVDSPNAPLFFSGSAGANPSGCAQPQSCQGPGDPGCVTSPTQLPPTQRVSCTPGSVGDFDGDGLRTNDPDICYSGQVPSADAVVQGGTIDLTGFSVAVGLRFHF